MAKQARPKSARSKTAHKSVIKISGGEWRGRNLTVIDAPGLRPTSHRIRETLFNWLSLDVPSAVCLDCFAGSGALGFEAASRGAQQVTMLEPENAAYQLIQHQITALETDRVGVIKQDVLSYLQTCDVQFNLVFIDPPYAKPHLRDEVLSQLIKTDCLQDGCKIFIEWPKKSANEQQFELKDERLTWLKQKSAGQVSYGVAQWQANG